MTSIAYFISILNRKSNELEKFTPLKVKTMLFGQKNGKYSTIKYYVRKIHNPWILGKHEIQYNT